MAGQRGDSGLADLTKGALEPDEAAESAIWTCPTADFNVTDLTTFREEIVTTR